jgi:hypothetical protein
VCIERQRETERDRETERQTEERERERNAIKRTVSDKKKVETHIAGEWEEFETNMQRGKE